MFSRACRWAPHFDSTYTAYSVHCLTPTIPGASIFRQYNEHFRSLSCTVVCAECIQSMVNAHMPVRINMSHTQSHFSTYGACLPAQLPFSSNDWAGKCKLRWLADLPMLQLCGHRGHWAVCTYTSAAETTLKAHGYSYNWPPPLCACLGMQLHDSTSVLANRIA